MQRKKLFWRTAVAICCLAIYLFTASPVSTGSSTQSILESVLNLSSSAAETANFALRKTAHAVVFGALAVFVLLAQDRSRKSFLFAWLFATIFGAFDEFHQSLVPGRSPAATDAGIDSFGAVIALLLANLYFSRKGKRGALGELD
jgi:VanZ family protein